MTNFMASDNKPRDRKWRWIYYNEDPAKLYHSESRLYDVGILADGSLHNPNGYPPNRVRAAIAAAIQRRKERRSASAKKAAVTRSRRHELKVDAAARKIETQTRLGPREHCYCCGKALVDAESIQLGIGPECWQRILRRIEERKERESRPADEQDLPRFVFKIIRD
jgi:hypothetical protein